MLQCFLDRWTKYSQEKIWKRNEKVISATLGRPWNPCFSGRERLISIAQTKVWEPTCEWRHIPQDGLLPTLRQGNSLSPHSLKTNQFKGCTLLPITLCLVADALFCPWKPHQNSEWVPGVTASPSGLGLPKSNGKINFSCCLHLFHSGGSPIRIPRVLQKCGGETEGKAIQKLPHLGIHSKYNHQTQMLLWMPGSACW